MAEQEKPADILRAWFQKTLAKVPSKVTLLYVEWNDGPGKKKGSKDTIFALFGYKGIDPASFNPEDPDNLDILSRPDWEPGPFCSIPKQRFDNAHPYKVLGKLLPAAKELHPFLSNRLLTYAEHDSDDVKVFSLVKRKKPKGEYYYELHVNQGANSIEDCEGFGLGGEPWGETEGARPSRPLFNVEPLLDHDPVRNWPTREIKLFLSQRPKLLDFLWYHIHFVCSERVANMFRSLTDKIQVFPAPLFKFDRKTGVKGYFVANLYEKLNCIPDEYVLPPAWKNGPMTFDPARGYKIKKSAVLGKHIFRLNYEYFRLVVSQEFRDRFDKKKITGVTWLRRESV
jgi:hypothetical protein